MSHPVTVFDHAIVRAPARSVTEGLRADDRGDPTFEGIRVEHDAYIAALAAAGVEVTSLPPLEAFPDSIFVEDPALVFTEGAILLRLGAPSRTGERAEIAPVLRELFEVVLDLPGPGFVDGGDVLVTPGAVLIGLSRRTDLAGAEALQQRLALLGRQSEIVTTPRGVLHFKTDCSLLDEQTVLTTPRLSASGVFHGRFREILTPEGEEAAANALRINDVVLASAEHPRTIDLLTGAGYSVTPLHTAEIGRIDAGMSCMSLRWRAR
ncbi:MAG: arginine deiminase family protein [Caulobacteraceae bacterium]|jgi:dimethylargininase